MKKQKIFVALFLVLFIFLFLGNITSAQSPNMAPPGGPHGDPCMAVPAGPDRAACHAAAPGPGGPNDHHGDQDAAHCRAMGMADGSPHVDPPQNVLDQVQAEYEANCKSGNCFLGEGNYKLLEDMGHTRVKVDCFLAEGHRQHDEQHGGPGPNDHLGRSPGDPGYEPPPAP